MATSETGTTDHHCSKLLQSKDFKLRFVIQRASWAEVVIEGRSQGKMEKGLVILFGIAASSRPDNNDNGEHHFIPSQEPTLVTVLDKCLERILGLRIFSDNDGKMNLSVRDVAGSIYLISQFTLFADCRKGQRPGFSAAARPPFAREIYERAVSELRQKAGHLPVLSGEFGADMKVSLLNDGPVTIIIDANQGGIL